MSCFSPFGLGPRDEHGRPITPQTQRRVIESDEESEEDRAQPRHYPNRPVIDSVEESEEDGAQPSHLPDTTQLATPQLVPALGRGVIDRTTESVPFSQAETEGSAISRERSPAESLTDPEDDEEDYPEESQMTDATPPPETQVPGGGGGTGSTFAEEMRRIPPPPPPIVKESYFTGGRKNLRFPRHLMGGKTGMTGQGNGGGWPSTTGNPSGGGRSNNN